MIFLLKILIFLNSLIFSQITNDYKKMIEQALEMQEQINLSRDIRIERISGSVKIVSDEGENTLTDNYQYPLESGDLIKTGYDGSAIVYIDNLAAIKIERNSEFEITDNYDEPVFTLNLGSLVAKVEKAVKKKFQFKIKTLQAVCAVRGTEFAIEQSKFSGESIFAVFDEGEIYIFPAEAEDDESKMIKLSKNSEVIFSPQSKNRRVTKISKMLRYKNNLADVKKRILTHKKLWKRFSDEQRVKYRNMLFKKKEINRKKTSPRAIKNKTQRKKDL